MNGWRRCCCTLCRKELGHVFLVHDFVFDCVDAEDDEVNLLQKIGKVLTMGAHLCKWNTNLIRMIVGFEPFPHGPQNEMAGGHFWVTVTDAH